MTVVKINEKSLNEQGLHRERVGVSYLRWKFYN